MEIKYFFEMKVMRGFLQRIGRKLYCIGRGDFNASPEENGEYWLLDKVVKNAESGSVFLDVGANRGDWSAEILDKVKKYDKPSVRIMPFEPSTATRALLENRFNQNACIEIQGCALSSERGELNFYSNGVGSGTNSLDAISGAVEAVVSVETLDHFMERKELSSIRFLKIDTEGFDFKVLLGAENALLSGKIELIQFEYNWRWLITHHCLRDVFSFIKNKPYVLGKLVGNRVVLFKDWHFELDRFFQNNYVLIRKDSRLLHHFDYVDFTESNTY